ncbi:FHA domain-containing protein [Roseiflexus castenholzii]|uniref:FHA domain-containing protein n=1 Tax=Roseiflexus castenholzii TaxID=120962 RepID=UPI003C7C2E8A
MEYAFEVCWGPSQCKTVVRAPYQTIGEVINTLVVQLDLPRFDARKQRIEYGLYRDCEGKPERIQNTQTLAQARIQAVRVYIANVTAPWWQTKAIETPPQKPVTDRLPRRKLPVTPSQSYVCRLQLAPNCVVVVQGDYLELNRNYLSEKLPSTMVLAEKARVFSGYNSRLMHVSRTRHCDLFRQHEQWYIRAHKPTYVNGQVLNHGQTSVIQPPGTTIVLGQGGWSVTVELIEQ